MDIINIIKLFYIGFTVYIIMVINATNLTFWTILPSIILMWINYFIFYIGYKIKKIQNNKKIIYQNLNNWLLSCNKISLMVIVICSVLFSIVSVKYYTGQTPVTVLKKLFNGISLYQEYQIYFAQQQIYIFSIKKLPFILMLFYVKIVLFYSYISFFILKNKTSIFEKFCLVLITLSYIYVGLARGTNFEFFELSMIVIFVILSKYNIKKFGVPFKILFIISITIIIFYNTVKIRGGKFDYYISRDVFYNPNGMLSILFPLLSFVTIIIYSYFGFGFFYISKYVSELWFSSLDNFIAGFVPLGFYASKGNSIPIIMSNIIDIGARWHPDSIVYVNLKVGHHFN